MLNRYLKAVSKACPVETKYKLINQLVFTKKIKVLIILLYFKLFKLFSCRRRSANSILIADFSKSFLTD